MVKRLRYSDTMSKEEEAKLLKKIADEEQAYANAGDLGSVRDDPMWELRKAALDHKGRP